MTDIGKIRAVLDQQLADVGLIEEDVPADARAFVLLCLDHLMLLRDDIEIDDDPSAFLARVNDARRRALDQIHPRDDPDPAV